MKREGPGRYAGCLWLVYLFLLLLFPACGPGEKKQAGPDVNPLIFEAARFDPARPVSVEGKVYKKIPAAGKFVAGNPPEFIPAPGHYQPLSLGPYIPTSGKAISLDTTAGQIYHIPKGKELSFPWPERVPVRPAPRKNGRYPIRSLTIDNGLKDNYVGVLHQDMDGRIWIGGGNSGVGISIWDGSGLTHIYKEIDLGLVPGMLSDGQGNIWFANDHPPAGVSIWDGNRFMHLGEENGLNSSGLTHFLKDREGRVWIGTREIGVYVWDGKGFLKHHISRALDTVGARCMLEDSQGHIWIGSNKGLFVWDGKTLVQYTTAEGLSSNRISVLEEDKSGNIWIGTQDSGVNIWNGRGFRRFTRREGLSGNRVSSLLKTRDGDMLIGTLDGGLNVWDGKGLIRITKAEGLGSDRVNCLLETDDGSLLAGTADAGINILNLDGFQDRTPPVGQETALSCMMVDTESRPWFGTNNDGIYVWNGSGYLHFTTETGLSSNRIRQILETADGEKWIGTDNGVTVWDGNSYRHYTAEEGLGDGNVLCLLETRAGDIWISTFSGLFAWDGETFTQYLQTGTRENNPVLELLEDSRGRIWIGTGGENMFIWEENGWSRLGDKEGYFGLAVFSMVEDEAGHIWIGGRGKGLYIWDGSGFARYRETEGLASGRVHSMLADGQGNIWAGTYLGLNRLNMQEGPQAMEVQQYQLADGLPDIPIRSICLDQQNRFWVLTSRQVSYIDHAHLLPDTSRPRLRLRELRPMFRFVDWRELKNKGAGQVDFDSVFQFTNLPAHPVFPHDINQLILRWEAIHWPGPERVQYSYHLEGKDASWSLPSSENQATLRSLSPGEYTFRVKAVSSDKQWSSTESYSFTILPPWWQSGWAYSLYALLIGGALYAIYRIQLNSRLEKAEAKRIRELEQFKSRFFTNITHEFRTPLTIILGMADKVQAEPQAWLDQGVDMIKRNGQNLLRLVNQMLDLSRLDSGKLQLQLQQGNVVPFFQYIIESFHSYAQTKNIRIHFLAEQEEIVMDYDADKLLDIVSNLISNAIKFTPKGGDVYLTIGSRQFPAVNGGQLPTGPCLLLTVSDSGIGIPNDQLPHIFDRFYQSASATGRDTIRKGKGAGIGLALCRELVGLIGGSIRVESEEGKGTTFEVLLPIRQEAPLRESVEISRHEGEQHIMAGGVKGEEDIGLPPVLAFQKLPIILIIEDNRDVAQFLASILKGRYQLLLAYDGQEGIDKAIEQVPDIIISDVMMPEKDGFEVCDTLKNDERTSHIPIILLTAKADAESRIAGLKRGADAYLAKPFHEEELLVRLEKLIELRQKLQKRYASFPLPPTENEHLRAEDDFLNKVWAAIDDHLDDAAFDLSKLCRSVGMSRSQVYRKLKALTGKSTTEAIRFYRLHRGKALLQNTDMNISEVAYSVGFSSLNYFTRCFKKEFGVAPSEWRK